MVSSGPCAAARVYHRLLRRSHHRWLRHLLLALTLAMVTLGVVGMHQLSVDHDVATGQSAVSSQAAAGTHPAQNAGAVAAMSHLPGLSPGQTSGAGDADGQACPDCTDHQMALNACLLALTLLVLTWMLAPPRPRHRPPFQLSRLSVSAVRSVPGRLVPALSLTELSLRRT